MKIKNIAIFLSTIVMLGFTACSNDIVTQDANQFEENIIEQEKCYIQFFVNKNLGRFAGPVPLTRIDVASAELYKGEELLGKYVTTGDKYALDALSESKFEVEIGKISFTLKLYNNSDEIILSSTKEVNMVKGKNEVVFEMKIPEGKGMLNIKTSGYSTGAEVVIYKIENNNLVEINKEDVEAYHGQIIYEREMDNDFYFVVIRDKATQKIIYQDTVSVETNRDTIYGTPVIYVTDSYVVRDSANKFHMWKYKSNNLIEYYVDSVLQGIAQFNPETNTYTGDIFVPVSMSEVEKGFNLRFYDIVNDKYVEFYMNNRNGLGKNTGTDTLPGIEKLLTYTHYTVDVEDNYIPDSNTVFPILKITKEELGLESIVISSEPDTNIIEYTLTQEGEFTIIPKNKGVTEIVVKKEDSKLILHINVNEGGGATMAVLSSSAALNVTYPPVKDHNIELTMANINEDSPLSMFYSKGIITYSIDAPEGGSNYKWYDNGTIIDAETESTLIYNCYEKTAGSHTVMCMANYENETYSGSISFYVDTLTQIEDPFVTLEVEVVQFDDNYDIIYDEDENPVTKKYIFAPLIQDQVISDMMNLAIGFVYDETYDKWIFDSLEEYLFGAVKFKFNNYKAINIELPVSAMEFLEEIDFGESMECLVPECIVDNESIKKITIGKNLSDLGIYSLTCLSNLSEIVIDPDNPSYKVVDNVLYSKDGSILYVYAAGKEDTTFDIPETVKEVSDYAFAYAKNLQTVTLNHQLEYLGNSVFWNSGITSFDFTPYWGDKIPIYMFAYTNNLETVTIHEYIHEIQNYCFYQSSVESVIFKGENIYPEGNYQGLKGNFKLYFPNVRAMENYYDKIGYINENFGILPRPLREPVTEWNTEFDRIEFLDGIPVKYTKYNVPQDVGIEKVILELSPEEKLEYTNICTDPEDPSYEDSLNIPYIMNMLYMEYAEECYYDAYAFIMEVFQYGYSFVLDIENNDFFIMDFAPGEEMLLEMLGNYINMIPISFEFSDGTKLEIKGIMLNF